MRAAGKGVRTLTGNRGNETQITLLVKSLSRWGATMLTQESRGGFLRNRNDEAKGWV